MPFRKQMWRAAFWIVVAAVDFYGASAQCPIERHASLTPPGSTVRLHVISIEPNSDLESDDDGVPFYDNHADIYGKITIEGQVFDLPKIEDDDFPHWNNVFEKHVTSSPVAIKIAIFEADSGLTGADNAVDVNPIEGRNELELEYDLCSLLVHAGVNTFDTKDVVPINAGSGENQATIRFTIELADGRPVTTNDLALVEVDLVQVLFHPLKLIAQKPTVLMVRIANNYPVTMNTVAHVFIAGGGVTKNDQFAIEIGAGQVLKKYIYLEDPIHFPTSSTPYPVAISVSVDDSNNENLPPSDCRRVNDGTINRTARKVVSTPIRYDLMWTKVGALLDGFNFVPDGQFAEIGALGASYIHGVFPLSGPHNRAAPIGVLPPLAAATDFLTSILHVFKIDNVMPFALVFELNHIANLMGCERMMGVLPHKDWFNRFSEFSDVRGLSLGEFAPRAVIFLPQFRDETGELGPQMTLPAHELGHTFGLSRDPTIKNVVYCNVNWPILGEAACGIAGGFDEYKRADKQGILVSGVWLAQGGETTQLAGLLNQEQCDSPCFMASSMSNAHLSWPPRRRWIDPADYEHLIAKLQTAPDPEVIYVSGMISWDDRFQFGSIQHIGNGVADRDDLYGAYAIRFLDRNGKLLKEVGLPVYWTAPDFPDRPRPVTFFGLNFIYPENARRLEVVNRMSAKILGAVPISPRKPSVKLNRVARPTVSRGEALRLKWTARDADRDRLQYFVMARSMREEGWFPMQLWQAKTSATISTESLPPGSYRAKVMASDGIHVTGSNEVEFAIVTPAASGSS